MPMITVDEIYCKGCGLCICACPRDVIALDLEKVSDKGYHPATPVDPDRCTGCAACAQVCPDIAITVER